MQRFYGKLFNLSKRHKKCTMPCSRELFSDVYLLLIVRNKSKFQSADYSTCVVYTVYTKTIIYFIVGESGGCLPSCEATTIHLHFDGLCVLTKYLMRGPSVFQEPLKDIDCAHS